MKQRLTRQEFLKYKETAYQILNKAARYFEKPLADLTHTNIISYFEENYPIIFNFYDFDEFGAQYPELPPAIPTNKEIKYKNLVKNQTFSYQERYLCDNCAGMTYPDIERNRFVVSISQRKATKGRIIFTILHELSHIFCHLEQRQSDSIYLSLATDKMVGNYPPELLALEQEADTVASILYLSDERLSKAFRSKMTFLDLQKETDISNPALHNRLMDFLTHTVGYSQSYSLKFVLDYRKGGQQIFQAPKLNKFLEVTEL